MTSDEVEQYNLRNAILKLCDSFWVDLKIKEFVSRDIKSKLGSEIKCSLKINPSNNSNNKSIEIRGTGKNMVDALYGAVVGKLSDQYTSLKGLSFVDSKIEDLKKTENKKTIKSKIAELLIANSRNKILTFKHEAPSTNPAVLGAVQKAIELFLNSEIAVIKIFQALEDAKKRSRSDLVQRFTMEMATLVNVTCYTKVLEKIKRKK